MRFKTLMFATTALAFTLAVLPAKAQDDGMNTPSGSGSIATHFETRLSSIEDQMRGLTGKVEQVDFILRRMDMALQRMQGDFDQRLIKLESAPAPVAQAPSVAAPQATADEHEEEPVAEVAGTLGGVKMRDGKVTGAIVNPKTPALPNKPADYGLTAQELYDRAFGLLRQANYEEAEKSFKGFIDKYPKDKLIDNAKYWYAETYYVRGQFADAAVSFAEAYQQNPKGTKAPDSLLKLAMSLAGADKVPDACGTLDALKAKYPTAPATIKARAEQERARLKCKKAAASN